MENRLFWGIIRLRGGEVLNLCVTLLGHDDKMRARILYGHKLDWVTSRLCRVPAWALFLVYGRSKSWPQRVRTHGRS